MKKIAANYQIDKNCSFVLLNEEWASRALYFKILIDI